MSGGHTRGPWDRRANTICQSDERGPQRQIADLIWYDDQGNADARLIAAAPELLEALQWALGHIAKPRLVTGQNDGHVAAYARAEAAIIKATEADNGK